MKSLLMKVSLALAALILVGSIVFVACSDSKDKSKPPAAATAVIDGTNTPTSDTLITLKIEEVRVTQQSKEESFEISTLALLPFNSQGEYMNFEAKYTGAPFEISHGNPYTVPSPWLVSIPSNLLDGQSFSIWFIVASPEPGANEFAVRFFEDTAKFMLPLVVSTTATYALVPLTPGVPDEVITGSVAVNSGRSLIGTTMVAGSFLLPEIKKKVTSEAAERLTEQSITDFTTGADYFQYVGEAHVLIPGDEHWYVGRRVVTPTTDNSLEIVFSVIETGTDLSDSAEQIILSAQACSEETPSTLMSGIPANVLSSQQARTSASMSSGTAFTAIAGDMLFPLVSYCDTANGILWWRVTNQSTGEIGWLPEFVGGEYILESAS